MKYHKAKTSDMYGVFLNVKYPRPANGLLRFDFVFTRRGRWYYISSSNVVKDLVDILAKPVENENEKWRVVETQTGAIFANN